MRRLLSILCSVVVCPLFLAGADLSQLRELDQAKRIFEIRRALADAAGGEDELLYYRAVVDSRFVREQTAIAEFREFLKTAPSEPMRRKAHQEMANAYTRLGQYGNAAAEWTEVLALISPDDPQRHDFEEGRSLWESLGNVAAQTIDFNGDEPIQAKTNLGGRGISLLVNGKKADWVLDTGANLSIVSESEATRLGLEIRDSKAQGNSGHTGKQFVTRPAVAREIRVGSASLRNVIVMVIPDRAMRFGPFGLIHLSGALGFPAIRAFGSMSLSANGMVRIQPDAPKMTGEPNIFFDDLSPIVEIQHAGRRVPMGLDTGGNVTYLYSSFREMLTPEERMKLGRRRDRSNGVGGGITIESELVPLIQFELLGKTVVLKNVSLRGGKSSPSGDGYSDGLLGMDAMKGGFMLDFRTMQLRLD